MGRIQGAIGWAGIPGVVYGTSIPYLTAHGRWWQITMRAEHVAVNTRPSPARPQVQRPILIGGVMEEACNASSTRRTNEAVRGARARDEGTA